MRAMSKQQEHECEFCGKSFVKESSLVAHSCAKKLRWLGKDNKNSIIAFTAYKRFYQLTSSNNTKKKEINFRDFIDSQYYNDFHSFGRWLNDAGIVNPNKYIDHVIKHSIKLKDWTKPSIYEYYLRTLLLKEAPEDAIERSIEWIADWCDNQDIEFSDFFSRISTIKFVDTLRSGKVSPWLFFVSDEAQDMLQRLDQTQMKLISGLIDPKVWNLKIKKHQKDIKDLREMMRSVGL
jgi:hypothetical protein